MTNCIQIITDAHYLNLCALSKDISNYSIVLYSPTYSVTLTTLRKMPAPGYNKKDKNYFKVLQERSALKNTK